MIEDAPRFPGDRGAEAVLADELARGDAALAKVAPVLGHLLGNDDEALFSDETVARVRGMLSHLGQQLAMAEAESNGVPDPQRHIAGRSEVIATALASEAELLRHCHALALEWQLTLRLEKERGLDPVLSPLLQALIASDDSATAALGMASLTAQARFAQAQRRMELQLGELPAELFHQVIIGWRAKAGPAGSVALDAAERQLRERYDEGQGRLALNERLVAAMGKGAMVGLSLEHAGVATFLSALAAAVSQAREGIVVATNVRQAARLMLALRSTGLKQQSVEEQLVYLHGAVPFPAGACEISVERAAALLQAAARPI